LGDLAQQHPGNPRYPHMLALCYRDWGPSFGSRNPREAMENLDRSVALLEDLVRKFPDMPEYRFDLCEAYTAFDIRHVVPEDFDDAEERLRKALAVSKTLVAQHPNIASYLVSRTHIQHKLSRLLLRTRRPSEAETCARDALEIQTALVAQFPDTPYYKVWQAMFRISLANVLVERSRTADARVLFEENGKMLAALLNENQEMAFLHGLLDMNCRDYAHALHLMGLRDQAAEAIRLADEHRQAYRAADRR
ncbi:MAG: tetratricopeptide repeat protein, partial [Planctomycetes bacterium]|nr:tetratricopeptide repeat protein [Planctomycetota bacterium]